MYRKHKIVKLKPTNTDYEKRRMEYTAEQCVCELVHVVR